MSEWYNELDKKPEETGHTPPPERKSEPAAQVPTPVQAPVSEPVEPPAVPEVPDTPAAPVAPPSSYHPPYQQPATAYRPPQAPMTPPSPYGAPQRPPYQPPHPPKEPEKKRSNNAAIVVLSVLCGVSLLICSILGVMVVLGDDDTSADRNPNSSVTQPSDSADDNDIVVNEDGPTLQISDSADVNDGGLTTSEIVSRNLDATVVLTMYQSSSAGYDFYGGMLGTDGELVQAGEASGIIMSEDGYIITNSHCVYNEDYQTEYDRIDVSLYDGRVYENATIIGYDPTTDLAVIKIDETGLSVAEFGDSSALSLGDRVITLGNSGGLQWSVSQGVLSGQARDVYEDTGYAIKCLQVDAIINPGSSGGPLLNAYGQVVGVNSAKIVLTGYEGLGFSIPINEAKDVIDDLVKYGYVTGRVALGITGRTITSVGYEGFMIESINTDSSLAGTKARAGDIITHVDGERVMDYAEMRTALTAHEVGDTVTLTLIRLNQQTRQTTEFTVQVVLQESR